MLWKARADRSGCWRNYQARYSYQERKGKGYCSVLPITISATAKFLCHFINKLFQQYRDDVLKEREEAAAAEGEDIIEAKCNKPALHRPLLEFELLNPPKSGARLFEPYTRLTVDYFLYHGLGSGKTCSSIAIAEGMKSAKQIIVMTPASLRRNYIEELKNCGDPLYKKEPVLAICSSQK